MAIRGVSISVPDGAFLVLLGPSGCGKTTLLRMLAGLELPSAGQIVFNNKVVSDGDQKWSIELKKRNSGLVFQSYALWPHMSVRGNIEWPLKVAGLNKAERESRVANVLKLMDIQALSERYPNEISGGQQQRVAIARTIAPRPGILLFDEPLSNLDARLRVEMRSELMRLHRTIGSTTVYVTHDQIEAMTMATHVAVMDNGRVVQFGNPDDLIASPQTAFVATFVGTPPGNIVPFSAGGRVLGKPVKVKQPLPEPCFAMYRAESLELSETESPRSLAMEVVEISRIAGRKMVTVMDGGLRLTAITDKRAKFTVGAFVQVELPAIPTAWFNASGERIAA